MKNVFIEYLLFKAVDCSFLVVPFVESCFGQDTKKSIRSRFRSCWDWSRSWSCWDWTISSNFSPLVGIITEKNIITFTMIYCTVLYIFHFTINQFVKRLCCKVQFKLKFCCELVYLIGLQKANLCNPIRITGCIKYGKSFNKRVSKLLYFK